MSRLNFGVCADCGHLAELHLRSTNLQTCVGEQGWSMARGFYGCPCPAYRSPIVSCANRDEAWRFVRDEVWRFAPVIDFNRLPQKEDPMAETPIEDDIDADGRARWLHNRLRNFPARDVPDEIKAELVRVAQKAKTAERRAVVTRLRRDLGVCAPALADAIERGEHRVPPKPTVYHEVSRYEGGARLGMKHKQIMCTGDGCVLCKVLA